MVFMNTSQLNEQNMQQEEYYVNLKSFDFKAFFIRGDR